MGHKNYILRVRKLEAKVEDIKAKLRELTKELDRISNDYIPDNDAMAPLALDEMREAIGAALAAAKEG